jgi:NAD(P)-dependent dehydrogenase (short-subunit alcohol dehydrogenase family)
MSESVTPSAVVLGVGPVRGLGAELAKYFAHEGLLVFAVGRSPERLAETVARIDVETAGTIIPFVADVTQEDEVTELFRRVARQSVPELVAYNVDRNERAALLDTSTELFEDLWRKNCWGGFLVGREAIRHFLPRQRGTLIMTGATASLRARPPFTAFAAAKAGLRALAQGMAREFGPQGIHVVHAIIDGVIDGDRARMQFPEYVAAKEPDGLIDPRAIAGTYWMLHRQEKSAWTHEIDLRPYCEGF